MLLKLKKKADFERLAKNGQSFFSSNISIKILKNEFKYNRFAVVVGLKVDKRAVVRNKIRRRINEIFKKTNPKLRQGFDLMFLTKETTKKLNFKQTEQKINELLKKAKIFN